MRGSSPRTMIAYLHYPGDETGYDFKTSHPSIHGWLGGVAALPRLARGL